MTVRTLGVVILLSWVLAVCGAAQDMQSFSVEEISLPITVERVVGTLTVISESGGTLLIDGVEITAMGVGEEIILRNIRVGQRHIEIRRADETVSVLVTVEKDEDTAVRISGTDADVFTASEVTILRSLRSLGGGVYFYDMSGPIFVVEASYSYYITDDLAFGGFVAFDKHFGFGKSGLQVALGDTRDIAAGLRVGFFYPDSVLLAGVCLYVENFCVSLDYSFPDPGWDGEIHIVLAYSFRL